MSVTEWMKSRWFPVFAAVAVISADRIAAALAGVESILPARGAEEFGLLWAVGHCDGMDGPVVTLARKAIDARNVNFALPWVRREDETEIRAAFEHALAVRELGAKAKDLADMHFFETLVRVHRAGEGAPYTGLKPAGRDLGPAIPAADRALEDGSVDPLVKLLDDAIRNGVHAHFHAAVGRKRFDVNDVQAGREYVEAYVPYIHYVERLWQAAAGAAHRHHAEPHAPEHAARSH